MFGHEKCNTSEYLWRLYVHFKKTAVMGNRLHCRAQVGGCSVALLEYFILSFD